jgi:hypothetical protein
MRQLRQKIPSGYLAHTWNALQQLGITLEVVVLVEVTEFAFSGARLLSRLLFRKRIVVLTEAKTALGWDGAWKRFFPALISPALRDNDASRLQLTHFWGCCAPWLRLLFAAKERNDAGVSFIRFVTLSL